MDGDRIKNPPWLGAMALPLGRFEIRTRTTATSAFAARSAR
jgi:hypothetical protein